MGMKSVEKKNDKINVLFDTKSDPEVILSHFPELDEGKKGLYYITALQVAVAFTKNGLSPLIKRLVQTKTINEGDQLGRTPLHYAVAKANYPVVEYLLQCGANTECKFHYNPTILKAAHDNHAKWNRLYGLLPPPDSPDGWGRTPLHIAAKKGLADIAVLLLKYGAKVDAEDDKGVTPLLLVGCNKKKETFENVLKVLVENGADVNRICYVTGTGPLFHAVVMESAKACGILLKAGAWITNQSRRETELHRAAANGLLQILQQLLNDSRITIDDINKPDECNRTPVYKAAFGGHRECLRLLIDNGGNLGTRATKANDTVLDAIFASISRPADFITDLLDSRIKSNKLKPNDECYNITLDFRLLAPYGSLKQMKVISNLIFAAREQDKFIILQHPLIESFLRIKWAHIRQFFFLLIYIYITFVISLSGYVVILINREFVRSSEIAADISRYFLLMASGTLLGHGFIQCILLPRHFVRQYELWMYISSTMLALAMAVGYDLKEDVPDWIYHVASIAVLLAWMELMLLIGRLPTYGYYALMFSVVLQNAVKVLLTFTCLVVGFAFSFSVQFRTENMFDNPWRSLVKTTVMMMGEYEYGDLLGTNEMKEHPGLPVTSRVIFLTFIVLASIVLMNLMVGLAVKDIQTLQQEGHVRRLEKQAEFVRQLEMVISLKIIDYLWLPKFVRNFFRRKRSINTVLVIQPGHIRTAGTKARWHKNLPPELVELIKDIAARNDGSEEDYFRCGDLPQLIFSLKQIIQSCEARRSSVISVVR